VLAACICYSRKIPLSAHPSAIPETDVSVRVEHAVKERLRRIVVEQRSDDEVLIGSVCAQER